MGYGLTKLEQRTLIALSEIFFSEATGNFGLNGEISGEMNAMLKILETRQRRIMRLLVLIVEFSTLPSNFKFFSKLPLATRKAYFTRRYRRRRIWRKIFQSLRAFCGMAYFSNDKNLEAIGCKALVLPTMQPTLPAPLSVNGSNLATSTKVDVDVVIVGSGAGGATVAAELAQNGLSVAVLEEGSEATREDFRGKPIHRFFRYYRDNGFTATIGNAIILLPMGRTVGGTTVINSGTCFRPPSFVLDSWRQKFGIRDMEEEKMTPLFEEIEKHLHVQTVPESILGNNGTILRRGAEEMKVSHHPIRRPMGDCSGQGQCICGCPQDGKLDMRLTYLPRAVAGGAKIFSCCRVEKILLRGSKACGIEAVVLDERGGDSGRKLKINARAVVVAAGAVHTPWLLLKNRLGSRQVGCNLRIHPSCVVTALFDEEILGWKGVMQAYCVDQWMQKGIVLESTFPTPSVGYASVNFPFVGAKHRQIVSKYRNMAEIGVLVSDTSKGRVRIGVDGRPWLFYSLNSLDAKKILEGIGKAAELLFAAGAVEVYPGIPGCEVIRSPREVERIVACCQKAGDLTLSGFHPLGTCRMGENNSHFVADSFGAVYGTPGLYIADASLIPSSIHVNPQITIMALAMRVARKILDNWR